MEAKNLKHRNPVLAVARCFLHLRQHNADPDSPICSYFPAKGMPPKSVTSTNIVSLLCLDAANIGFRCLGFYPHYIGSRFICSGGSITLHQSRIPNSTIKIIVRWHSDAFLIYLQVQVVTFTKGVATAMAKIAWFHHQFSLPCYPSASSP